MISAGVRTKPLSAGSHGRIRACNRTYDVVIWRPMPKPKTFTFYIPDDLKAGLQAIKQRDGVAEAETIRRAIRAWIEAKGIKADRKRGATRKRP